jgi:uncharacterized membrane protein HdeD (DUF308 family)
VVIIYFPLYPFFNVAIYLNLILLSAWLLLICFFRVKPPKNRRISLLVGAVSIIFGCVMVIISLFGMLSFSMYLTELDLEGSPAMVLNLHVLFVVFILVGFGLIVHGVLKIAKKGIEKNFDYPADM